MQRFVIERTVPGVGDYSPQQINDILEKTRTALQSSAGRIQWQQSFIAADKVFSIYVAPDESSLRELSKTSPLPTDAIHRIRFAVDPTS